MQKNPNVLGVTFTSNLLTRGTRAAGDFHWEGKDPEQVNRFGFVSVDYDFIEALNIPLAGGQNFPKKFPERPFREFLVNETAARIIDTELPVGKRVGYSRTEPAGTILGVVKDYHFMSLQNPIRPLILYVFPRQFRYVLVRIGPQNVSQTLQYLEEACRQIEPGFQFECLFLDDALQNQYRSEGEMRQIFGSFTILAILISCLGLIGLASFIVERRRKEIGIRKVLGAKAAGLLNLVFREFALLVAVSSIIAWPGAYYAMTLWLQNFAFRTNIRIGTFLLATAAALIIALATVSFHAGRAAVVDPVSALKHE
jgi:putative ABC transport system permease protein